MHFIPALFFAIMTWTVSIVSRRLGIFIVISFMFLAFFGPGMVSARRYFRKSKGWLKKIVTRFFFGRGLKRSITREDSTLNMKGENLYNFRSVIEKNLDIDKLSKMALEDPSTSGNPKKLTADDMKLMYKHSMSGELFK